jgi:hypothetical protein
MRNTPKIVSLATALAALATPAAVPAVADAADLEGTPLASEPEAGTPVNIESSAPKRVELMSFTVFQTSDGEMFPQHGSHVSHASHVSGIGIPNVPDTPNLPSLGGFPTGGSTGAPATTAAPAADPVATACARASAGYGVNQIVSELESTFGLSASDAQSIAKQALSASLNGGTYCSGSHSG